MENTRYESDFGKLRHPGGSRARTYAGTWGNLTQTILILLWDQPVFYYRAVSKVLRKCRPLTEILVENKIIFPTRFPTWKEQVCTCMLTLYAYMV